MLSEILVKPGIILVSIEPNNDIPDSILFLKETYFKSSFNIPIPIKL